MKTKEKIKKIVGSARRLLQYFQFPDKNSRDISWHIYNFLLYFKIAMHLFRYFFFSQPLTVFCGTVRFRGTLFQKHCSVELRSAD